MRERVLRKTLILHPLPRKNKNSLPAVSVDLPDCNGSGHPPQPRGPLALVSPLAVLSGLGGTSRPQHGAGVLLPAARPQHAPCAPLFLRGSQGARPLPGWFVDEEGSAQDCTRSAAQGSPVTLP